MPINDALGVNKKFFLKHGKHERSDNIQDRDKNETFNIIKMLGNLINSWHLLRHTFTTLSTVSTRVTRRLEKIAQILEKVAQRVTKPK